MNRKEQAAWSVVVDASKDSGRYLPSRHALTLIDMMCTPGVTDELRGVVTMPREPTPEALVALILGGGCDDIRRAYRVLFKHFESLRKPATDAPPKVPACDEREQGCAGELSDAEMALFRKLLAEGLVQPTVGEIVAAFTLRERGLVYWTSGFDVWISDAGRRFADRLCQGVVMPREPTPEALEALRQAWRESQGDDMWGKQYRALYDELARPRMRAERRINNGKEQTK